MLPLCYAEQLILQNFSTYLQNQKLTGRDLPIEHIYTTGFPLTLYWREAIHSFWGCNHVHAYSLSEVFGQALTCDLCPGYHFDPYAFVEFLNPTSGLPITEGLATIVATTLYPYTQMMPLIRYDTDDLAWVYSTCQRGIGFLPLGRQGKVFFGEDGTPAVFPADVLEVVTGIPWIGRSIPPALASLNINGAQIYGMPKFVFSKRDSQALIELEVEGLPPSRAEMQAVEEALLNTIAHRRRLLGLSSPSVEVQFVSNRSLPLEKCVYGCPTAGRPIS